MNQIQQFCRHCGQPMQAGASFCVYCGNKSAAPLNEPAAVPAGRSPYPLPQAPTHTPAPLKARNPVAPKIILILAGILLLLFAVRAPAALLFGKSATARIESVNRVYNRSGDSMEYNYRVYYVFSDGDRQRSSNYDMPRTYNYANLPKVDSLIQVKYIPGASFISYPVGMKNTGLGSLVTGIIGIGLIILAIKGNVQGGFRKRR